MIHAREVNIHSTDKADRVASFLFFFFASCVESAVVIHNRSYTVMHYLLSLVKAETHLIVMPGLYSSYKLSERKRERDTGCPLLWSFGCCILCCVSFPWLNIHGVVLTHFSHARADKQNSFLCHERTLSLATLCPWNAHKL